MHYSGLQLITWYFAWFGIAVRYHLYIQSLQTDTYIRPTQIEYLGQKGVKKGQNMVFDFFLKNGSKDFSAFMYIVKAISGLRFDTITFLKKNLFTGWSKGFFYAN